MAVEVRRSVCNRDCPDACALVAEVEDGRLKSLKGDPRHPVTKGFLCYRTSHYPKLAAGPRRLTRPLVRSGGRLVESSLDAALDLCAEKLLKIRAESGPAAIFHYRSGGSLGLLKQLADRFFEAFGPCTTKIGDICSGAGEAAQELDFGTSDSNDLFDLLNSRHILLWGKNPFVSSTHLVPVLKQARAAGAELVSIDPIWHKAAGLADVALQPRPGGDLALALGVGRALLDAGRLRDEDLARCDGVDGYLELLGRHEVADWASRAGVALAALQDLARRLAEGPAAILVGWGMQRRHHGGAIVRALDALSAVTGNLFRSGGGCSFYFKRRGAFADLSSGAAARHIREPLLGADLLAASDPPVRAMWVTAGNPVLMLPDSAQVAEAIDKTEFVVVVDPLRTETAERADVVLPVPNLLEDSDLLGAYGHHWLGESRPLLAPPPGVVHEVELLQKLAERVGLGEVLAGSVDDWKARLLEGSGTDLAALRGAEPVRNPQAGQLLFADGTVPTPSGRVQLLDASDVEVFDEAAVMAPARDAGLWLFSNSVIHAQAGQWSGEEPGDELPVCVHPDAAPAGCAAGDRVRLRSSVGVVTGRLVLDAQQRPDVALVPKGGSFARGVAANALIPARATDCGLGAAFLDVRVTLEAL